MSLIKACKSNSHSLIESEIKKSNCDVNSWYIDDKGNKIYPITCCCINGFSDLVELLVNNGAETNRYFINNENKEVSVIDWACKQNNIKLVEILLNHGAIVTYKTFKTVNKYNSYQILELITPYLKSTIAQLYRSKAYQAYKSKLISYSDRNVYSFAFNVGQANFIAIRKQKNIVIIDAGFSSSELSDFYSGKKLKMHIKGKIACDNLVKNIEKFKKSDHGKVIKLFTSNSLPEMHDSFQQLKNSIYDCFGNDTFMIDSIKNIELEVINGKKREKKIRRISKIDQDKIDDAIKYYKDKFISVIREENSCSFRILFRGKPRVEAVFITHPHIDHYSLLSKICNQFPGSFSRTKYYIGGPKNEWNIRESKKFLKEIKPKTIEYLEPEYDARYFTFLKDVKFKVLGQSKPKNLIDKNQFSLIISVYYEGVRILFTGDAEGEVLKRIKIDKPNVDNMITEKRGEFYSFVNEIESIIKTGRSENAKKNIRHSIYSKLDNFLKDVKDENAKKKYKEYVDSMLDIENSLVVYEPHHGSMTANSHEIYNYLYAQDTKQLFFVSSFLESKDLLPSEESVCNKRKSKHVKTRKHPIVYFKNGIPTMSVTTDPVFITGSAPENLYLIKIEKGQVGLQNLDSMKPEWETFIQ